jgi:hypothetical protein
LVHSTHQSSPRQWALFFFTLLYVCLEFGFNNQLLKISAVDLVSDDVLLGLEFWGRILSGIGLSLVLYRNSSKIKLPVFLRYLACLIAGIVVMWQVQITITDYLVEKASLEDKEISLILATLSSKAASGTLKTANGHSFFIGQAADYDRKVAASLFPALSLYTPNRLAQIATWSEMSPDQMQSLLALNGSEAHLSNAYRNLIIPPLTLGISIFFALLNLAQWCGMCLQIFKERLGLSILHIRLITSVIFIAFLLYSFTATSAFADSKAYQKDLAPSLYANHFVLAVLTSISAHAVPNWHFLSSWCNRYVLGGIDLKRPY